MEIQRTEMGGLTILRPEGDLDQGAVNDLRRALLACLKDKRCNVIVNLGGVHYISFMCIGVLIERRRQLRALSGDLKLTGLNLFAKRTFHMASVTSMFSIYDTEAQAVEGFREAA